MSTLPFYRILRDPDAPTAATGGAAPAPTTTPTPASTPASAPATAPPVTTTTAEFKVSAEEYRKFLDDRARLAQIDTERQRDVEAKEAERLKALVEKGHAEEALKQLRESKDAERLKEKERGDGLEKEILLSHKNAAITNALLKVTFADEYAAEQVRQLLESRFVPTRGADGKVFVQEDGTGKPAAAAIAEWLASKPAERFLAASSRGGAGSKGGDLTAPTPPANQTAQSRDDELNNLTVDFLRSRVAAEQPKYGFSRNLARVGNN